MFKKFLPIYEDEALKRRSRDDDEEEGEGGYSFEGGNFIGFDTFLLGVIFQYDEQHTKVSVEMKVIYLGLESRGKHHCQSLFKVVRYFSSKESESERAKSANLIKTQRQNIHEISKLR